VCEWLHDRLVKAHYLLKIHLVLDGEKVIFNFIEPTKEIQVLQQLDFFINIY